MIQSRLVRGTDDLSDIFSIREQVFVKEQGFDAAADRDGQDELALHALVTCDDAPAATARLYPDGEGLWHIGRVAVLAPYRGQGLGDLAMRLLLISALSFGAEAVYLGSQLHAIPFYEKLGFAACGPEYLDEGAPHLPMSISRAAMERLFAGCDGCRKA